MPPAGGCEPGTCDISDATQQLAVPGRVGTVQPAGQDGDRVSARGEHALVRGTFDAVGATGDDDPFLIGKTCRQLAGDVLAIGGRGA